MREAEREKHDGAVDAVDVVDVDLAILGLRAGAGVVGLAVKSGIERRVDVLVHERQNVRLLDRHDVVEIEGLVAVGCAQLLLELDGLLGRVDRVSETSRRRASPKVRSNASQMAIERKYPSARAVSSRGLERTWEMASAR